MTLTDYIEEIAMEAKVYARHLHKANSNGYNISFGEAARLVSLAEEYYLSKYSKEDYTQKQTEYALSLHSEETQQDIGSDSVSLKLCVSKFLETPYDYVSNKLEILGKFCTSDLEFSTHLNTTKNNFRKPNPFRLLTNVIFRGYEGLVNNREAVHACQKADENRNCSKLYRKTLGQRGSITNIPS